MLVGFLTTIYYMARTQPWLREFFFGISKDAPVNNLWWEVQPISAGIFGVPLGFLVIILVSLVTPPPAQSTQDLVDSLRYPAKKVA
jgi:cation/acetate symporter